MIMRPLRVLACVLIGIGLLIQGSAYAAAPANAGVAKSLHCEEMMIEQAENANSQDDKGLCNEMRLDCLVSMNCISPLLLASDVSIASPFDRAAPSFAPPIFGEWSPTSRGPEPPPPQLRR